MQSVFMRAAPGHCENSLKSYRQFSQYFGFAGMEAQEWEILQKSLTKTKRRGQHHKTIQILH